jgi:hypothetical protein
MLVALRYETFGDLPEARDRYDSFLKEHKKDLDQRFWYVFAAWRHRMVSAVAISGGPEKVRDFRKDLLAKKQTELQNILSGGGSYERLLAEKIARDVADLYKNDPAFKVFAEEAAKKLAELKRPPTSNP